MHILILGQARTGTTALYTLLKHALPATTRCCFEPETYIPEFDDIHRNVLVKMLMDCLPNGQHHDLDSCKNFDRTVLLLRDPRDRLVSSLLFLLHWSSDAYPPLYYDRRTFDPLIALLAQKEQVSRSVPMWRLFEAIMALRFGLSGRQPYWWLAKQQQAFLTFQATHPGAYCLHYEDLIAGKVGYVASYLGFPLHARAPLAVFLPPAREHVSILRNGLSGEWVDWFCDEDIAYFRPIFDPYLSRYGYNETWTLPQDQKVAAEVSSRYVQKWCRIRRRRERHAIARSCSCHPRNPSLA